MFTSKLFLTALTANVLLRASNTSAFMSMPSCSGAGKSGLVPTSQQHSGRTSLAMLSPSGDWGEDNDEEILPMPEGLAGIYSALGRHAASEERNYDAVAYYRKAIAAAPWSAEAHGGLGKTLIDGFGIIYYDEGIKELRTGILLSARNKLDEHLSEANVEARVRTAELCVELALSLLHIPDIPVEFKQTEEAFAALRHACALAPGDGVVQCSYELAREEFKELDGELAWEHEPTWIELSALVSQTGYDFVVPEFVLR